MTRWFRVIFFKNEEKNKTQRAFPKAHVFFVPKQEGLFYRTPKPSIIRMIISKRIFFEQQYFRILVQL